MSIFLGTFKFFSQLDNQSSEIIGDLIIAHNTGQSCHYCMIVATAPWAEKTRHGHMAKSISGAARSRGRGKIR